MVIKKACFGVNIYIGKKSPRLITSLYSTIALWHNVQIRQKIEARTLPDISLVVVPVAQGRRHSVEDITDADSGAEIVDVDSGVHAQLVALAVRAGDLRDAGVATVVLPDAEVAVDEGVVQEENWVGGRGVCVLHDGANAVVAPSVSTTFGARGHIGVRPARVAGVDDGATGVDGARVVAVAGEAVALIAGTRTDVDSKTGKLLGWC